MVQRRVSDLPQMLPVLGHQNRQSPLLYLLLHQTFLINSAGDTIIRHYTMKIYAAMPKPLISQLFGKKNTAPSVLSLYQSLGLEGHDGWDFRVTCENGSVKTGGKCEPIYCDIDGYATITYISRDVKNGFGIIAQDQDPNYKHLWWHFDSINPNLKVGDRIEDGIMLGIAGNTGYSTGAHLHRALYSYAAGEDNGYHGAIDIDSFYVPIFVLDHIKNIKEQISIFEKAINFVSSKTIKDMYQNVINILKKQR